MENLIISLVGVLMLILAYAIGVKKKINLMHDYHIQRIKPQDVDAYVKTIGLGLLIIALGFLVFVGINLLLQNASVLIIFLGFAIGISIMVYAQYKYNGGIFS